VFVLLGVRSRRLVIFGANWRILPRNSRFNGAKLARIFAYSFAGKDKQRIRAKIRPIEVCAAARKFFATAQIKQWVADIEAISYIAFGATPRPCA
jgi:hypothetical protein